MEITKIEQNKVEIQYTIEDNGLTYMDTISYDDDKKPTDIEFETIITDKFYAWKTYINTTTPKPTKEQYAQMLEQAEKKKITLDAKIEELKVKVK